jgi:hypothetical protein
VLAHRSNSELALQEALVVAEGAELDVVFDPSTRRFDVRHPPVPTVGFTLDRALQVAAAWPHKSLWLDWKNPDARDLDAAVAELLRLDAVYGLKSRTWIETAPGFKDETGRRLTAAGFRHAHYIDPAPMDADGCRPAAPLDSCRQAARRWAEVTRKIGANCVSFDIRFRDFTREMLKELPGTCSLSWDTGIQASSALLARRVGEAGPVDAFVVPIGTDFDR